jgi:DNA-binding response OmpR family regulator
MKTDELSARRVLVVEDNRDFADALQGALLTLGHEVKVCHDGASALVEAASFKPEIGVLDVGLPEMDGYVLAGALRASHDIRLVAVTGFGKDRDRQRALDAGFDAHLVKPVTMDQLAEAIGHMIAPRASGRSG